MKGMRFEIDVLKGQKTGFYLDQLDNYEAVAQLAGGLRTLDCFSNQGTFAIACAKAGAALVTAIEINADLVQSINQNARRNEVRITTRATNAFDFLAQCIREKTRYDLIILDPPSFAKSKDSLGSAWRGYKEIHLRALQILASEGLLVTFSCSHHVSREMFLQMVVDASVDAKRHVRMLKQFSQPLDHPILPHIPETEYLKGFLLKILPGR
jgi:23S rRNA (cytosine1962-C5)-methyltransferase